MNENSAENILGFYIGRTLAIGFEEAMKKVTESLLREGFGVVSDIDIQKLMKEKMDTETGKHRVLGILNPKLAFSIKDKAPVMLPCSLVFKEKAPGIVEVAAIDPLGPLNTETDRQIAPVAGEVREKLSRTFLAL